MDEGAGIERAPTRRHRRGIHPAPPARRARVPLLPRLLQARHRHHAPHTVVRRAQGGRSSRADDTRSLHAVREADIRHAGALSTHARRCRLRCCAIFSWRSGPSPTSRPMIWRSSARVSGRSSPRASQRRLGEYEGTSWWDFVGAEQRSASYQKFLAAGITRSLVAAKARTASTRTIGDVFVQLMLTILNPVAGSTDRVFDGPTNLVWIDPWRTYLESSGVQYSAKRRSRRSFATKDASPASSSASTARRSVVHGDHYIAALPIERIAPLVNGALLAADPALANLRRAGAERGVDERRPVLSAPRRADRAWARHSHRHRMGTHEHLAASVLAQRAARAVRRQRRARRPLGRCLRLDDAGIEWTPRHAVLARRGLRETWRQLKRSINCRQELLRDEDLHSWFLDPDIDIDPTHPGFCRMPSRCW